MNIYPVKNGKFYKKYLTLLVRTHGSSVIESHVPVVQLDRIRVS